jgi:DNA-binding helix-hairpin-helix protein with protein kinase domain
LLIFHILFGGRHPYSGTPLRADIGESLEANIKTFRYAYARDGRQRGLAAPSSSIPVSLAPDSIRFMLERAFTEQYASKKRPSASEWRTALDALRGSLKRCPVTAMHVFPSQLVSCPWCSLEAQGVIYFIYTLATFVDQPSGFNLAKFWATIEAIQPSQPVAPPNIKAISVVPVPLPPDFENKGLIIFLRIISVLMAIGLFAIIPRAWWLIGFGALISWSMAENIGENKRNKERSKRHEALKRAETEFQVIERRVQKESSPDGFNAKLNDLTRLRDEHQGLKGIENQEINKLEKTAVARQKQKFLERFFIDSANIPGIGPARKASLRSFGIETAADVEVDKVMGVYGFGQVLTQAVIDWKKSCESRFVFDPRNAVSENDKNQVHAQIEMRRRTIEAALVHCAGELHQLQRDQSRKISELTPLWNIAATKVAQAQADLEVFKG